MSEPAKPELHPFERLKEAMRHVLSVPKEELLRREAEYREQRRGKKTDAKTKTRAD